MTTHRRAIPGFWQLQLFGWLAFGISMATSRIGRFPFSYMIPAKIVLTALGLATSLVVWRLYRRLLRRGIGVAATIAVCVVVSYVAASIWTAVFNIVDIPMQRALLHWDNARIGSVFELFVGSVYHAFALFGWSVLYFGIKHYEALLTERERSLRAEALASAARLQALRYQINPHFLFNTLNAISTLVFDGRTDEAGRMISRLSDFLRATLEGGDSTEISLAEEIDFVRRYLEIEQVRFGSRLAVEFDIDGDVWAAAVPTLLLQPLVENAIRHAIAPRETGGTITIGARRQDGRLVVTVTDDGDGPEAVPQDDRPRIGLANTRSRLAQLHGSAGRFDLSHAADVGTIARVEIPFRVLAPVHRPSLAAAAEPMAVLPAVHG
jgi:sensor histidine kinase YesM